ncbi:hypothetical protein AAMO2058_000326200 [Amorphochlora amoebiformis]
MLGTLLWFLLAIGTTAEESMNVSIAAFNIQVFGESKFSKPDVVTELLRICKRYDMVVVQEIRDSSETVIYDFQKLMNQDKSVANYSITVGARQGRSSSKEQYAFLYKPSLFKLLTAYDYTDTGDKFEREPYVAQFEFLSQNGEELGINTTFVALHTTPRDVQAELDALPDVYEQSRTLTGTPNSILLGDFNADCSYLSRTKERNLLLKADSKYHWLVGDEVDTTVKASNCAYDRVIIVGDEVYELYVPGTAKPFKYDSAYGLSKTLAEDVSDHYPIEFLLQVPIPSPPTSSPTLAPTPSGAGAGGDGGGKGGKKEEESFGMGVFVGLGVGIIVVGGVALLCFRYRKKIFGGLNEPLNSVFVARPWDKKSELDEMNSQDDLHSGHLHSNAAL